MNKYLIVHKIKTLAYLCVGFKVNKNPEMMINNYIFNHWDYNLIDGHVGKAWLVKKEVKSKSFVEAINQFRRNLDKIIQRIAFVSQCYMDFYREPFIVYKLNNNEDRLFLYEHTEEVNGGGLCFEERELNAYNSIVDYKHSEAFRFLQECNNTIGYIPKLIILFSALEALCEKIVKTNDSDVLYTTYDKNEMINILGGDLFNEIFGDNGVRHKLNHGEMVDLVYSKNYVEEVHKKIISFFNKENNINITENITSPQRHFYNNYMRKPMWLKPSKDFKISLKSCIEGYDLSKEVVDGCSHAKDFNVKEY